MQNSQLNIFQFSREFIQEQAPFFDSYFHDKFYDTGILEDLEKIAQNRKAVYVFSGVIRDFFLGRNSEARDLDVVLTGEKTDILCEYLQTYKVNQFGGMKVQKYAVPLDLWFLKQTWGIKVDHMISTPESLVNTAFFNFSAIVFDYKKKEFIFHDSFLTFLNNEVIDYVYEKNPYPELCVVNTIHYSQMLQCRVSTRLGRLICRLYAERICDYTLIQERHFGVVKYTNANIESFINQLKLCIK